MPPISKMTGRAHRFRFVSPTGVAVFSRVLYSVFMEGSYLPSTTMAVRRIRRTDQQRQIWEVGLPTL